MKTFIATNSDGTLSIDKILFESYYPILFTCKNEFDDTFFCVCCQCNQNGIKWLVGKTNNNNIIKVLKDEITVRELLLHHTSSKICIDYVNEEYFVTAIDDWMEYEDYLPKEDSYMYAEPGEFDEEISYFSEKETLVYDTNKYKSIFGSVNISSEPNFTVDENIVLSSIFGGSKIRYDEIILMKDDITFSGEVTISSDDIIYQNFQNDTIKDEFYNSLNTKTENELFFENNLANAA